LYWYLLILIQYWEKTLNTIKILIWYFSISNNIFFFILTSYLGNDILGNVYYHQNTLKILSLQYVVMFAVIGKTTIKIKIAPKVCPNHITGAKIIHSSQDLSITLLNCPIIPCLRWLLSNLTYGSHPSSLSDWSSTSAWCNPGITTVWQHPHIYTIVAFHMLHSHFTPSFPTTIFSHHFAYPCILLLHTHIIIHQVKFFEYPIGFITIFYPSFQRIVFHMGHWVGWRHKHSVIIFDMRSCLWLILKASNVFLLLLLSHITNNQWFRAGSAVFGNFFGEQPLNENLPNFGVVPLFKKESDCAIFYDFIEYFKGPATIFRYRFLIW